MRLFIPTIGQPLRLTHDWTFTLYEERRNSEVWQLITGESYNWSRDNQHVEVTLPAGTLLAVDRIYIRKGSDSMSSFDSLTFWIKETTHPKLLKGRRRFWAKLHEVNFMQCDIEELKETILKGIIRFKNRDALEAAKKQLDAKRFEIGKTIEESNELVVFGPRGRFEEHFHGKLKFLKTKGWSWSRGPYHWWTKERDGFEDINVFAVTE